VQKKDGEAVLFSWVEWPSKDVRDAGMTALMADARMKTLKMPFDGQRMIFGGFSPIVEKGSAKGASYTDGFVVRFQPPIATLTSGWLQMRPACSRNMARCVSSKAGATTCPMER
jgi:hypothetical protein